MNELPVPDLRLHEFRGIQELEIPRLGRVNLIAGKNATGKSSILDAARIHCRNPEDANLQGTLVSRHRPGESSSPGRIRCETVSAGEEERESSPVLRPCCGKGLRTGCAVSTARLARKGASLAMPI